MGEKDEVQRNTPTSRGDNGASGSQAALDKLLAELGLHRTELEIQNEELRRIQTDLEGARDKYHELFETAPVAYFLLGSRAQILTAKVTAAQLLGLPRDELIGRSFPAFIDPIEAHRFHLHHQKVFEHPGVRRRIELRVRRNDRIFTEALVEATCIQAGDQRLCRMALVDLSEQRQLEEKLTDRQAHLTAILNTVVDSVVTIDGRGIIESVNTGTERMFGFTQAELVGQPIAVLMPEPHRARYQFLLRRFLDYGDESIVGRTREVPAQRRDGSVFPAELTVGELRLEQDRHYVGVIRDISERRQQDARIRENLARFQEIAERIEDVFYVAEASSGHVLHVSPAFDCIFGRALDQQGDRSWGPWIHPDDRERVRAALARAAGGGRFEEEYRILRPDGSLRIVRDRAFPMWQPGRITGILRDVTEERRLEQEARHAQRLEAVGTLASGIAHDFNNLLMGLAGLARQALRALPADHPAAGLVQRSLESTERGVALTRQLLMFSGQRRAQAKPVELDAACRATRALLDRLVGEHIRVSMETNAPGLGVMAEPGEIEQILLNLATNSRDAMPSGGELTVRTQADADARRITLSVIDTGAGMSPETRLRIFEPFYTTKGVGQGTGLGLSTVFTVVRQRGGEVHVDSTPGRGTVMTIELPVVASNLASELPDAATPHGTETVLAVEDDALVRETIQGYLQALGYTVLTANHPDDALEIAASAASLDLLLTDVMMPGRLGGELARELRRAHPDLRVLFMSAHPQSELLRLRRLEADDGLLCKPFSQHELGVALRAVLDRPHGVPTAQPTGAAAGTSAAAGAALIIDDDPDVAESMRDALEEAGVSATVAHTGPEAVRLAGTLHPKLVLCDVGLGNGMSGYEVARALRADAGMRDALLVAVTGLSREQCGADATAAGFDHVLTKPIDLSMLEKVLAHFPGNAAHGNP